ncbi:MAG: hypothetical protein PHE56_00820 [Bacteroidales bacterium]|nr:hypothetical protein [Bacteroidales bacterium]
MKCKVCNKEITGRKDKIFCSIHCKNEYHLTLGAVTRLKAYPLDRILHRNRSILLEIMGTKAAKKMILRSELVRKKFQFKYITHFNVNSSGKMYHHVYDFAWMEFSDDEILIIRQKKQWIPEELISQDEINNTQQNLIPKETKSN